MSELPRDNVETINGVKCNPEGMQTEYLIEMRQKCGETVVRAFEDMERINTILDQRNGNQE